MGGALVALAVVNVFLGRNQLREESEEAAVSHYLVFDGASI